MAGEIAAAIQRQGGLSGLGSFLTELNNARARREFLTHYAQAQQNVKSAYQSSLDDMTSSYAHKGDNSTQPGQEPVAGQAPKPMDFQTQNDFSEPATATPSAAPTPVVPGTTQVQAQIPATTTGQAPGLVEKPLPFAAGGMPSQAAKGKKVGASVGGGQTLPGAPKFMGKAQDEYNNLLQHYLENADMIDQGTAQQALSGLQAQISSLAPKAVTWQKIGEGETLQAMDTSGRPIPGMVMKGSTKAGASKQTYIPSYNPDGSLETEMVNGSEMPVEIAVDENGQMIPLRDENGQVQKDEKTGQTIYQKRVKMIVRPPTTPGGSQALPPDDINAIAQAVVDGNESPLLTGYYRNKAAIVGAIRKLDPTWNHARAELDYTATQKAMGTLNGSQQTRLRQAVDFAAETADNIDRLYQALDQELKKPGIATPLGGYRALNSVTLAAAKQLPGQAGALAQRLEGQIADLTADLGNVYMGGNSPTDKALGLAEKNLSSEWNQDTFRQSISQVKSNLRYRKNSIMNSGIYTPGSQTKNPYVAPTGMEHNQPTPRVGSNTFTDPQSGKSYQYNEATGNYEEVE